MYRLSYLININRITYLTGPATDIGIKIARDNWGIVKFWSIHWIGFPSGSFIRFNLVHIVNNN